MFRWNIFEIKLIIYFYFKTKHTEIVVTEDDFFNAIPQVIYMIESYDITTVRASVGNYLVAKYIANNSKAKVIFNGEDITSLPPQKRVLKGMGFVPQTNNIFPSLTVQENLEMGAFIDKNNLN